VTIERHSTLAGQARATLARLGYGNVEVRAGDGSQGAPDRGPFAGISVTATMEGAPPEQLLAQLALGAALVGPVRRRGREMLVRFRGGGSAGYAAEPIVPVRFVPLVRDA
jgi:protein-L-isoaspartate(D-aspartate) O-methyltransferase